MCNWKSCQYILQLFSLLLLLSSVSTFRWRAAHRRVSGWTTSSLARSSSEINMVTELEEELLQDIVKLRPYQEECIKAIFESYQLGINRQGVSLPVGSGKTVIFSSLIGRLPRLQNGANKVLILAHRRELLLQAKMQLARLHPQLRVSIECAEEEADVENSDVVVASVQSLGRKGSGDKRLQRFNPLLFKCIVVDEAHHTAAPSYAQILKHFGFKKLTQSAVEFAAKTSAKNAQLRESIIQDSVYSDKKASVLVAASSVDSHASKMLLCGFSATFLRNDALTLASQYEKVVYHLPIADLIRAGYLCEVNTTMIGTSSSISDVKQQAGDYKMNELSLAIDTPNRNKLVAQIWYDHARVAAPYQQQRQQMRNSTIVFGLNVQHVQNLLTAFNEIAPDVRCEIIHAKTPQQQREQILDDFAAGQLPVLLNCAVLTEGFDLPNTDCIVMTRPTCNAGLYIQMVGRGLRKNSESKRDCLVLDFVDEDNGSKRTLQSFPNLMAGEGGDITDEYNAEVDRRSAQQGSKKKPGLETFDPKKRKFVKDIDQGVSLEFRAANLTADLHTSSDTEQLQRATSWRTFRYGREEFGPSGQIRNAVNAAQETGMLDPGPPTGSHLAWCKLDNYLYMTHSNKLILVFQYQPYNVQHGRVFEIIRYGKDFEWMQFSDFPLEWEPVASLLDDVVDVLGRDNLLHLHMEDTKWRREEMKFENNPRALNELMKLSEKLKGESVFQVRDSSVGWTSDVMLKYELRQKYFKRRVKLSADLLDGVPRYGSAPRERRLASISSGGSSNSNPHQQLWNARLPLPPTAPGWPRVQR